MILVACSDGSFHTDRNHFKSVYGLSLLPPNDPDTNIFVGRAVDESGNAIANAKVHAYKLNQYLLTNEKGGFQLVLTNGDAAEFIILDNQGRGAYRQIAFDEVNIIEDDRIALTSLATLTGSLQSDGIVQGQTQLIIDGFPIQTFE